ncbi:hypothetical protein [Nonomuraea sediminis]|uniref:hypothetical protein n=1 Tax=Nonomuraea sediminis TaxID=2835864 RepID=UPI001BDC804A|nr:hypothetical protein [Nonomuraea sediminis]
MFARVTLAAIIALAPVAQQRVVSADPVDFTPHVLDGIVNAIALVGGTVVVGGSFTEVADPSRTTVFDRENLFAFDLATGRILTGFEPDLDGPVYGLTAGPGGTVYVGGDFSGSLTRLSLTDGSAVPGFEPRIGGGMVTTLARRGSQLYAGGDFTRPRTALARLDATTGAADPRFTVTPGAPLTPRAKVYALAVSGDRLVVDGSFTTLDGRSRPQLGVIDTGTGKVADWRTEAYVPTCMDTFPSYVRGLDLSPDGRYFVVVSTGGPRGGNRLCDSAVRFETYAKGQRIAPTWVNKTGGDSLYAVSATGAAVYVGGHQRWMNNPLGHDSAGPGAVPREGIAAIDPRTGKALAWNPGRERGIGVKAFLAYSGGLLVGSDTTRLGREYHARLGMFPLP